MMVQAKGARRVLELVVPPRVGRRQVTVTGGEERPAHEREQVGLDALGGPEGKGSPRSIVVFFFFFFFF